MYLSISICLCLAHSETMKLLPCYLCCEMLLIMLQDYTQARIFSKIADRIRIASYCVCGVPGFHIRKMLTDICIEVVFVTASLYVQVISVAWSFPSCKSISLPALSPVDVN